MHRILIIGTGSIGERHLRCFKATGRATVGMCEVNDKLRGDVAARYDVKEAYSSLDAALAGDRRWHAAVVATPANTHIPIASRLADLGVHLCIEKPLSTTTDGISDLIERVRAKKIIANVAYVYRAHPVLSAMREAVRSGRFGRPMQVVAMSGQNFPFHRPAYRNIYYAKRSQGGGAIQDAMTHVVNASEWLIGPITRLSCDAAHQVLEGVEVEDTVHLIARHGPVMASYSLNQYQTPNEMNITVICERGTARFEAIENRWRWMTEIGGAWKEDEAFPKMERDDWFIKQSHAYLDALEGKRPVLCTLEEGLQTLKVNLAALASADNSMATREV